jgi:MraZ protein
MILLGQYRLSINGQGFLGLPSSIRAGLQDRAYLVQGFDRNLLIMTVESFDRYYSQIKSTSLSDPLARLLARLFLANAVEVDLADSAQIPIPTDLREFAGLDDQAVLVGQGDYYEIWAPSSWDEQTENIRNHQANADRFSKFDLSPA